MLREVLRTRIFVGGFLFFVLVGVGGVLYLRHVDRESAEGFGRTQERVKPLSEAQKSTAEVSVGDTSESGHVDGNGTPWHAAPHTPKDFSEVPTKVQDARDITQEANTQVAAPMPDLSKSTRDRQAAWKTYNAWYEKSNELGRENRQLAQELLDVLSIEGLERYNTDENVKREVQRRVRELAPKIEEIHKRMAAHDKEKPALP